MRRTTLTLGLLFCSRFFAQPADPQLKFEVATVKPSVPGGRGGGQVGGPGTSDPERMAWRNLSLLLYVTSAYGIRGDQLSAPAWFSSESFDISANVPPGTTHEQFQQMLQNLLAERFHMQLHHVPKDFPAYNLVVGKNKPKLKPLTAETIAAHTVAEPSPGQLASTGQPRIVGTGRSGQVKITARAAALSDLAGSLRVWLGRRVVDKTGLAGKYDFVLEFSQRLDAQSDSAPYIFDALREQLGLELEETKIPLDFIVVDHVDRTPAEN